MIFYNKYKKFRIENNIDLKDISKRTKIDLKYLQALERGKFAEIPPVYVKLFYKAYINEIGVEINEALFELDSFLNQKPNSKTLKFIPGDTILKTGTADFSSKDVASDSPLASRLFEIDGVSRVFLATDFISVTKDSQFDWNNLKPSILTGIMEHYSTGLPAINETEDKNAESNNTEDSETIKQIKDLFYQILT